MSLTRCCVVLAYWLTFQLLTATLSSILQLVVLNKSFLKLVLFILLTPDTCPSLPLSSGSPAELCQLCVDDEIVAVNGVAVANINYTQWKDKMTSSLQTGSLTMDIRRYGNKGEMMS